MTISICHSFRHNKGKRGTITGGHVRKAPVVSPVGSRGGGEPRSGKDVLGHLHCPPAESLWTCPRRSVTLGSSGTCTKTDAVSRVIHAGGRPPLSRGRGRGSLLRLPRAGPQPRVSLSLVPTRVSLLVPLPQIARSHPAGEPSEGVSARSVARGLGTGLRVHRTFWGSRDDFVSKVCQSFSFSPRRRRSPRPGPAPAGTGGRRFRTAFAGVSARQPLLLFAACRAVRMRRAGVWGTEP